MSVSLDFLHEITLWAIDIDNIGCLEPFLPIWEHFWNRGSVQLNCIPDLTPRLKRNLCYLFCWDAPGLSDIQNKIEQQKKQEKIKENTKCKKITIFRIRPLPISIPFERFHQMAIQAKDSNWTDLKVILVLVFLLLTL